MLVQFNRFGSHYVTPEKAETHKNYKQTNKQTQRLTDFILGSLERSGLRLVNFWASLQAVMMKKKTLRMMMKHTGPKKLQMRPYFRDSQQLVRRKETYT